MTSFEKTKKIVKTSFPFLFFFLIFIVFYTKFYPLYIYDTDDWGYIAYFRHAIPLLFDWNPTRVMPETIMPLVSRISAFCLMPFNGSDLVQALADGYAIFFSIVISIYFCMFGKFFQRKFNLKYSHTFAILLLMLLLHVSPFVNDYNTCNNQIMFLAHNCCCMFFYVLSFLITMIFVTMLETFDTIKKYDNTKLLQIGLVLLLAYLVINSNMFQSIMLAAFVTSGLLLDLVATLRKRDVEGDNTFVKLKLFCRKNYFNFILLVAWFVAIAIETSVARAGYFNNFDIKNSLVWFWHTMKSMNTGFLLASFFSLLLGAGVYFVERRKGRRNDIDKYFVQMSKKLFLSFCISLVYLILLCAKFDEWYVSRAYLACSWLIWIIWLVAICWAYIASKKNITFILLPLVIYIVFFEGVMCTAKFKYCNLGSNSSFELVKALDQNIIDQVLKANRKGQKYVEVHVPSYPEKPARKNFPLGYYAGHCISDAMFNFGLTRERIEVKLVPDNAINKKFGVHGYNGGKQP